MRVPIRCYWLAFKRDLKMFFTRCDYCRSFGAYPCSLAASSKVNNYTVLAKLCTLCQIKVNRRLSVVPAHVISKDEIVW